MLSGLTVVAAILGLLAFVVATVFVLLMYLPSGLDAPNPETLERYVADEWDAVGWDQQVAAVQATYLKSLRNANKGLANKLTAAVVAEGLGSKPDRAAMRPRSNDLFVFMPAPFDDPEVSFDVGHHRPPEEGMQHRQP